MEVLVVEGEKVQEGTRREYPWASGTAPVAWDFVSISYQERYLVSQISWHTRIIWIPCSGPGGDALEATGSLYTCGDLRSITWRPGLDVLWTWLYLALTLAQWGRHMANWHLGVKWLAVPRFKVVFQFLHPITSRQCEGRARGGNETAQCSGGPCCEFGLLGELDWPRGKLLLMVIGVFSLLLEHSTSAMDQGTFKRLGRFGQDLVTVAMAV